MKQKEIVSIYIDGFNFYCAAIRREGSDYYYPSMRLLCEKMLTSFYAQQNITSAYEINEIHYFTAEVKNTREDPQKQHRQRAYNNSLAEEKGVTVHRAKFKYQQQEDVDINTHEKRTTEIRREKGTDVHIAVQMLNDAWEEKYDHGVLISNDSDFIKLLEMVAEKKTVSVWYTEKVPTKELANKAHYTHQIKPEYIRQAGPIANEDFKRGNIDYP